jgi:hypothetical protein
MTFISYAQNQGDVMLYRALGDVKQGFYIDVGAQDPVIDSVTKAFYDGGWHGIDIEPSTEYFQKPQSEGPTISISTPQLDGNPGSSPSMRCRIRVFRPLTHAMPNATPRLATKFRAARCHAQRWTELEPTVELLLLRSNGV